jgi:antitoxin ParD1/3/4
MATSLTIDDKDQALIESLVESGRYRSAEDVVKAALRLIEKREQDYEAEFADLRAEIQKGFDSGPPEDVGDMFERIKADGRRRLAAENAK